MQNPVIEFRVGEIIAIFRGCPLFEGVAEADLESVASITGVRAVAKGDYLVHERSPANGFFIVYTGAIKVHRVSLAGKEQVLHVYRANESFGEEALISDFGCTADASAVEDSVVLMVQKPEFLLLLRRRPELALCVLRSMSQHISHLVDLLDDLTLKDVKTRLAKWLLRHCPDPESQAPCRIELPTTKRVLAAELGTVSETFSRTVAKLRKQRLIAVEGNTLILLCPVKLTRLVRHCAREQADFEDRQVCCKAA